MCILHTDKAENNLILTTSKILRMEKPEKAKSIKEKIAMGIYMICFISMITFVYSPLNEQAMLLSFVRFIIMPVLIFSGFMMLQKQMKEE